jgi:hypothetical protein
LWWWPLSKWGFVPALSNHKFIPLDSFWRTTSARHGVWISPAGDIIGIVVRLAVLNHKWASIRSSIVVMEEIWEFCSASASAIAHDGFGAVSIAGTINVDFDIFIVARRSRSLVRIALTVVVDISSRRIAPRHDEDCLARHSPGRFETVRKRT